MLGTKIVGLLVASITVAIVSCDQPTTPDGQPSTSEKTTDVSLPSEAMDFDNENWNLVLAEAKGEQKAYVDSRVDIKGKVAQVIINSDSESQVTIETEGDTSFGNNTLVVAARSLDVQEEEWVRVVGILHSYWETENLLGATLNLPVVVASLVTPITRSEAVPPLVTVTVQQSIVQHGLAITLERLELADSETRVYVSAFNNSPDKASLYSFDAVLVQGSQQIERKSLFLEEIEEPATTLVSGTETQGVLLFEPVEPGSPPIRVIWENPRTENYRVDFDVWEWEVSW